MLFFIIPHFTHSIFATSISFFISVISSTTMPEKATPDTTSTTSNSIIIKILPSNPVVPLLPHNMLPKQNSENTSDKKPQSTIKSRSARKIIPKIIIDNC